jgi:hypothetical protein
MWSWPNEDNIPEFAWRDREIKKNLRVAGIAP